MRRNLDKNQKQKTSDLPDSNQQPKDYPCTFDQLQSTALPTEVRLDLLYGSTLDEEILLSSLILPLGLHIIY